MQFMLTPEEHHLFGDAVAAYCRSRADYAEHADRGKAWSDLWIALRDAETYVVTVPDEIAGHVFHVWADSCFWRDEPTWRAIKDQLRPQWRKQIRHHAVPR